MYERSYGYRYDEPSDHASNADIAKAARESGEIVGKIANYNREGRATVHYIARTTEGKEVLACGARLWSGGLRGRVSDDAEVTCSRCAKKVS